MEAREPGVPLWPLEGNVAGKKTKDSTEDSVLENHCWTL